MVRIINKTSEEFDMEERDSKLVDIAKSIFPNLSVTGGTGGPTIVFVYQPENQKKVVSVSTMGSCMVHLDQQRYLDEGLRLAGECERLYGKEFTLKKDYRVQ